MVVALLGLAGCGEVDGTDPELSFRVQSVQTLAPIADTFYDGSPAFMNTNYGAYSVAVVTDTLGRASIRFSAQHMASALEDAELVSATLRFHLKSADGFGAGKTVHLHRLVQEWQEGAATFNCSIDTNVTNSDQDCSGTEAWHLGDASGGTNPWVESVSTTTLADVDTVLEFDVTQEVEDIVSGISGNDGWVIALADGETGLARIYTREGLPGLTPELELTIEDAPGTTGWEPPDPAVVAPEPDLTVIEDPAARMSFLYEGVDPVQINVMPNAIADERVGVIRGRVLSRSGLPMEGVQVTILDHPELGETKTRSDGYFDIAANGGGQYEISLQREGLFDVQRRARLPWNEFVDLGEITMIGPDLNAAIIDLTEAQSMQSLVSSPSVDARGVRRAVAMFRPSTTATMYLPGGGTQVLSSTMTVHATEYTVGDEGPDTMPGPLPRSSGYTYAVEYTVDEAEAAGATMVSLDPPAVAYVENFTGFLLSEEPVAVPVGGWNPATGVWEPSVDGVILKIIGTDLQGYAEIDIDDDNSAEPPSVLASLGIDDAERAELIQVYDVGDELWRAEVNHFSAWDLNWGVKPPEDAESPPDLPPRENQPIEEVCEESGSIIECENQVLGERVPVPGTGLSLNYRSSRVEDGPGYRLKIPVTGSASLPASIEGAKVWANVAGRRLEKTYSKAELTANMFHEFVWDGLDVYGKPVQGHAPIDACVSWLYPVQYLASLAPSETKFGYDGDGEVIGTVFNGSQQSMSLTRCFGRVPVGTGGATDAIATPRKLLVGGFNAFAASDSLGGWTLSNHHTFSPETGILYRGDGYNREVGGGLPMIETFAGNGQGTGPWDNDERLAVQLGWVEAVSVDGDGDVYVGSPGRIVQVSAVDGTVTTVAGDGSIGDSGDGGQATSALISTPTAMDFGPDGSLYFVDQGNLRIRKIAPDGVISTVAGDSGSVTNINDLDEVDPSALTTSLGGIGSGMTGLAVGPDGSIYYLTRVNGNGYVRRVMPTGTVRHFAGYPSANNWVDDTGIVPPGWDYPTPAFRLATGGEHAYGLDVDGAGNVYAGTDSRLVRFDGAAHQLGADTNTNAGAKGLVVSPEGGVFWSRRDVQEDINGVYVIEEDARRLLAGGGDDELTSGIPAVNAKFTYVPEELAMGPDGSLYIGYKNWVRRVYVDGPGRIVNGETIEVPNRSATEVYVFDDDGRHLSTKDPVTGVTTWTFAYDVDGRLVSATDRDGQTTTINRDGSGKATSITGPTSLNTPVTVDIKGRLEDVTYPDGNYYYFEYDPEGLLTYMEDLRQFPHEFQYDADMRLVNDIDPAGGFKSLSRKELDEGFEVTLSTKLGVQRTHRFERPAGDVEVRRTHIGPDGNETQTERMADGSQTMTRADGTVVTSQVSPDPRFGMAAKFVSEQSTTLPISQTVISTYQNRYEDGDDWVMELSHDSGFTDVLESRYDTVNRTLTSTSPEGRVMSSTFDVDGRVVSLSMPGQATVFITRNVAGRITEIQQGVGPELRKRTFTYDTHRWLDLVTSYIGVVSLSTDYGRNGLGQIVSAILPDATTLGLSWDSEGRVVGVTPPGKPEHLLAYDAIGQLTDYDPPLADPLDPATESPIDIAYDSDHRLKSLSFAGGDSISVAYGAGNGRVSSVSTGAGLLVTPTYDPQGRVSGVDGPYSTDLSFGYDGSMLNSVTWSGAANGTVSRTIGTDGRVASRSINGGMTINYTYDADGQTTQVGQASLTRDAASGRVTLLQVGGVSETRVYNTFGELDDTTATYGSNTLYSYSLQYDPLGRITQDTQTVDGTVTTWDYTYDDRGRLSTVDKNGVAFETYTYDDNGNRLSVTSGGVSVFAAYDDQDRLVSMGSANYVFDADGNLSEKTDGNDTWVYKHDAFGNLTLVTLPDLTSVEYDYDSAGRRTARYVDGVFDRGWLWEGHLRPIAEVDVQGNVTARYVYGSRRHVPDYVVAGGVTYRLLTDYRGSIRIVVDADTGTVVHTTEYGPWGDTLSEIGSPVQSLGFAGGLLDSDTGHIQFGERSYDPGVGRWTARDPILFAGKQANLYEYVMGNPVGLIDPKGTEAFEPYEDLDGALVALMEDLYYNYPVGMGSEFSGWLGLDPNTGDWFYTEPWESYGDFSDPFMVPGAEMVWGECFPGEYLPWHTHPNLNSQFSSEDQQWLLLGPEIGSVLIHTDPRISKGPLVPAPSDGLWASTYGKEDGETGIFSLIGPIPAEGQ